MALIDNIAAYWKMDEASGTRYDATSANLHLTDTGSVGSATGKLGYAADLSGSGQYFTNSSSSLNPSSMTISCWVYLDTVSGINYLVTRNTGSEPNRGYELYTDDTALVWTVWDTGGTNKTISYSASLSTSTWYHIVATYSSTAMKLYINGSEVGTPPSVSVGARSVTANTNVGFRDSGTSGRELDGRIDEVGIWSRAISSAEVTELYNSGSAKTHPFLASSIGNNIVSYWKMQGNSTDEIGVNTGSDGAVSYSTSYGKIGQGVYTNGAHITVNNLAAVFQDANPWTVNMWANFPSLASNHRVMGANTSGENYTSYAFNCYISTDGSFNWYHGNGTNTEAANSSASLLTTNTWYMLTITHDGTTVRMYKDGNSTPVATLTRSYTSKTTANIAQIGAAIYSGGTETSSCYLDEIGVWSRALSTSEISSLYASGSGNQYPFASTSASVDALMFGHFA